MDNQTDVSIKFKNSVTGEKKLEKYAQTLSTIKSVLDGIDKGAVQQMEQSATSTKKADTNMEKMSKNFNMAFNYTALRTFARGLSKVVEGFTRMTARSTAFLEDFNLFQVAFRGNYTEATKFVNKLSEMYGLDEDWLIKTTAQFKQLSNAMGLAEETGEKVSKLMTQLSIDISSLYNIDVDRASSVLQSALAGQTKPVRALGADITQATLQQTLSNLDISQQVSQLSYAEKRLLIMISLTQQLSGVTNDWGRTLESPSNQIRIMNEQWQRLQRNVGNIFLQIVGKVLPYLNAVLMVLNEIAKVIASLFGYKLDDFDFFDESTVGGVEDFGDALDGAADSAKKLKQGLRGFDKLNVISTPSDVGGVGGVGGGAGGINPKLMDAFNKAFDDYNKKLTEVQMKATKIRDKIMEWLGFTKQVDDETGEVNFKFDHITGGTVLGALAVGGSIYRGINFIMKMLNKIGLIKFKNIGEIFTFIKDGGLTSKVSALGSSFEGLAGSLGMSAGTLALVAAAIVAIGAALIYAYKHNDKFKEKVDNMVKSVVELFKNLYERIKEITKQIWEFIEPVWNMIKDVIKFAVKWAYDSVVYYFSVMADFIKGFADILNDIINGDIDKAFDDFGKMIENLWGDVKTLFKNMFENVKDFLEKFLNNLADFLPKLIEKINDIINWFKELPEKLGEYTGKAVKRIWKIITETNWGELGQKIVNGIVKGFIKIGEALGDLAYDFWVKLKNNFKGKDWKEIGLNVLKAIIKGMNPVTLLYSWSSDFLKGLKKGLGIHSPSQLILDAKIGDFSMEAIMLGMERQLPLLKEEAENIVDTLNSGMKDASVKAEYSYDLPSLNSNLLNLDTAFEQGNESFKTSINPTFIIQVGNKEIAKQVINDLQDMATNNGKPITIGG